MDLEAVIFDLDGVLVSTDEYHYQAWRKLADVHGIYFDRIINESLRGVSRMESLEIVLKRGDKSYSSDEKQQMAQAKNQTYVELLSKLTPHDILSGTLELLDALKNAHIKTAVASSSKNAKYILKKIELDGAFDAVVDGTMIQNSKPDPEVFLKAADIIGVEPENCAVVEDAHSGIEGAVAANMKAVGVFYAKIHPKADLQCNSIADITIARLNAIE